MEYILKYDESKGNKYEGSILTRNIDRTPQEDDLTCVECGKQCKSKGGLTNHRRLKHGNIEKRKFKCEDCGEEFVREANLKNHEKSCSRTETNGGAGKKTCECGKEKTKPTWARHRRKCRPAETDQEQAPARVYRQGWKECDKCGENLSKTNMARHQKTCRGTGSIQ